MLEFVEDDSLAGLVVEGEVAELIEVETGPHC